MFIYSNQLQENTKQDMLFAIRLVDYQLDYNQDLQEQIEKINPLTYKENTRLTIIDQDGTVLGDTSKDNLENHRDRIEIIDAMNNEVGYSIRYSDTLNTNLMYVALFNGNQIIRISIPYDGLIDNLDSLYIPFLISFFISILIAYFATNRLVFKFATPTVEIVEEIEKMNQKEKLQFKKYPYEEYNTITNAINNQIEQRKITQEKLKQEQIKIRLILDKMNEGFILLDDSLNVLSINEVARGLFNSKININDHAKDFIFDQSLIDAITNASKRQQVFDYRINDLVYACYVGKVEYGINILFVDVTAQRNAMKMREEFFSNVSHELKTPVTSIKGYIELLQANIIQDESKKNEAYTKVQKEVDHISILINDILTISRLESKDIEATKYRISIPSIVQDCIDSVSPEASRRNIEIIHQCGDLYFQGNRQHIHQVVNNLIVNAIKYNVDGGKIIISCKQETNYLRISVEDTGIGIPLADQQRVFERFYRVEKGREKTTGGTGLGLAIVKHVVQYYDGYIDLESTLNKGTKVSVYLAYREVDAKADRLKADI